MKLRNVGSNQTELELTHCLIVFFSYNTPVAASIGGKHYRTETKYSVTTSKHINRWLDGIKAEEKPQEFFDNLLADK